MKNIITALLFLVCSFNLIAQSGESNTSPVTFSAYAETYYSYDLGKPASHNRPNFVYSHNRHNEFNLNLGFVKAAFNNDKVRANLALAAGTYMNANLAAEPGVLRNIFEANTGVKLAKNSALWLDAGIFASHIGFESAIGKDCWNLTRSILADNSPYYESGLKLSYSSPNEKWFISVLALNGWQRIQRVDGNNTPAFGHQLTFKPNGKITLNSSSFIGNDKPDDLKLMRYFHNFYGQFLISDQFGLIAGFDIGAEQVSKGSDEYNTWYAPVLIAKYSPNAQNCFAARIEYYEDTNGVIISTGTPNGFRTTGYSINYDRYITENVLWRIEARSFISKDRIFVLNDKTSTNNFFVTSSISISF